MGDPQPQALFRRARQILHGVLRRLAGAEDPPHPDHELLSLICKGDPLGAADHQLDAQLLLQRLDGGGDGRLGHIEGLAGLGEVFILVDRVQILQPLQIQHTAPPFRLLNDSFKNKAILLKNQDFSYIKVYFDSNFTILA